MKRIPSFPKYIISEDGTIIIGTKTNNPIKAQQNDKGYLKVSLYVDSKTKKRVYVHRLVAETYIDNPNGLPFVNHLDFNKQNNNVNNLEWCTHQYNMHHAKINGRCTRTCITI